LSFLTWPAFRKLLISRVAVDPGAIPNAPFSFGTGLALLLRAFQIDTFKRVEESMSIQKKSLISTLKTAKKANVASDAKGEKIASMRLSASSIGSARMSSKSFKTFKGAKTASLRVV
jgi:hypothetical protein